MNAPLMTELQSPLPMPHPLPDSLPSVPPFEPELLPESIRGYVMDVSQRMQSAPDFAAVTAICGLSAVQGSKVLIMPKAHDDWAVTPTAWGALVGGPSTMKTPNLAEMLRPIHSIEAREAAKWEEDLKLYKAEAEAADIEANLAKSTAKRLLMQDGRREEAIMHLASKCSAKLVPTLPRIIINDATVEALGERLRENPNGMLLVRDELSGLVSRLMQEEFQADRAFFLEAFNGNSSFTYDRIGRGTIRIDNCTLSLIGGIQPSRLAPLIRGAVRGTSDDGMVQRLLQLAVWPDPVKSWRWIDRAPNPQARARYYDAFEHLHALQLPSDENGRSHLRFTPEAQALFIAWMEELQNDARSNDVPEVMQSHLLKMPKTVAGLALLFELVEGGTDAVGVFATGRALDWADYLRGHANRLYSAATHNSVTGARLILQRKAQLQSPFKAREVQRKGWQGLHTPEEVASALELLLDHGYLQELVVTSTPLGGRPTRVYYWAEEIGSRGTLD